MHYSACPFFSRTENWESAELGTPSTYKTKDLRKFEHTPATYTGQCLTSRARYGIALAQGYILVPETGHPDLCMGDLKDGASYTLQVLDL